jgi:hypothetical protein
MNQVQIQETNDEVISKAKLIATLRQIRRFETNRNIGTYSLKVFQTSSTRSGIMTKMGVSYATVHSFNMYYKNANVCMPLPSKKKVMQDDIFITGEKSI